MKLKKRKKGGKKRVEIIDGLRDGSRAIEAVAAIVATVCGPEIV